MAFVTGPKLSIASSVKGATAPPTRPKSSVSTDPLYTQALEQAKAALAAQQQPILDQQAASDTYYAQRQQDANAEASALSKLLANLAPGVQQPYTTAAQNQALLAGGFSQGMKDALQGSADQSNALLSRIGSPAQIDSHAAEAGDVLYGLGGYIPASTMNREGAAFGAVAAGMPQTALLSGQEQAKQLGIQGDQAHQKFSDKIAELAGNLPGDVHDNYQKLQQMALADKKFALQVQNQKFSQALKSAQQKLAVEKYATDAAYKNAQLGLSAQRLNLQAQKFARQQLTEDRNYQLSLSRLGISKKNLQLRAAQQAYKMSLGGFTPSQIAKFDSKMQKALDTMDPGTSYEDWVRGAIENGVPLQMAIQRANQHWPATQRPTPQELSGVLDISKKAAAAATVFNQTIKSYNRMTGASLGQLPDGNTVTWTAPKSLSAKGKKQVQTALTLAQEYLGTPYVYGGESPKGFDCSGLAQYVYAKAGVNIPRTTYDQWRSGVAVPKGKLAAGDLVFFKGSDSKVVGGQTLPGHVGIYLGNGLVINAPKTGDVVKIEKLTSFGDYMGARRYAASS